MLRLAVALILLLTGFASAQEFGYEEGRITSVNEDSRYAVVVLEDGRIVSADMGQALPGAEDSINNLDFSSGQQVEVYYSRGPDGSIDWAVSDWVRRPALYWLGALFLVITVVVNRFKGLRAIMATVLGLVIIISYVVPAILAGQNPVMVSLIGTGTILLAAIYFVHGVNWSTTAAVIGTFAAVIVTMFLGIAWTDLAHLTGLGSEDGMLIAFQAGHVNLRGLVLAGMLIGALGALTDVTIVQASVVRELAHTNPDMTARNLYLHGMNVGNDHIGSLVNTLVLAYAGTALPLLMLLQLSDLSFSQVLNLEVVATEVVHTLVGSIGLILGVPLTTAIAAILFRGDRLKIRKGELDHAHHHH